jgi:hypothetical protein
MRVIEWEWLNKFNKDEWNEWTEWVKSWKFEVSSTHIACLRILLFLTRDDNFVEKTLNEIDDYWLKTSNDIHSFFFFFKSNFLIFSNFSIIATTFHKCLISLMWKHFKTKSIAKNSKQKKLFRFFSFFLI